MSISFEFGISWILSVALSAALTADKPIKQMMNTEKISIIFLFKI